MARKPQAQSTPSERESRRAEFYNMVPEGHKPLYAKPKTNSSGLSDVTVPKASGR